MITPITLNVPHGPAHYWAVMRRLTREQKTFTVADLYGQTNGVSLVAVRQYLLGCVEAEWVERVGEQYCSKGHRPQNLYRVIKTSAHAPVIPSRKGDKGNKGLTKQQLWTAMRTMRTFMIRELSVAASTDDHVVSHAAAAKYVQHLARAGALVMTDDGRGCAPATYRLKKSADTGPNPPMILNASIVFDTNKNRVVGEAVANEVSA